MAIVDVGRAVDTLTTIGRFVVVVGLGVVVVVVVAF